MSDHSGQEPRRHKWHAFDPKLKRGMWGHYVAQTAIATAFVFALLVILRELGQFVIVAALGSSAFVVFAMPHKENSRARYVVGGHVFCFLVGTGLRLLLHNWLFGYLGLNPDMQNIAACSLAVGAAIFVMVVTDTEHPPAAGTAVGTAISDFSPEVAVSVILGAIMLSLGKIMLRRWLKDLL